MMADTESEDALSQLEARVAALGSFQVALTLALERAVPNLDQHIASELRNMQQLRAKDGAHAEAAVINGIIKQLNKQRGLVAND